MISWGPLEQVLLKANWSWAQSYLRQGKHSHTEKPGMLEPRGQALLEQPNADTLDLIEHL